MNPVIPAIGLCTLFAVFSTDMDSAFARGGPDVVQFGRHGARHHHVHVRYPGDIDVGTGTVRYKGPEKGPYIERCYWIAKSTFYGIPTGITQRCERITE